MNDGEDDYELEAKPKVMGKPLTVRPSQELGADIEFIADLLTIFDKLKVAGVKGAKPKKFKPGNVALLFAQAGRDRWAKRLGGELPKPEDRAEYLRQAKKHFEALKAREAAAKSKK